MQQLPRRFQTFKNEQKISFGPAFANVKFNLMVEIVNA